MEDFFSELEDIYKKLQEKYINAEGTCIGCDHCCTSLINYPPISILEYDFLEARLEKEKDKILDFKRFISSKTLPFCPFYSDGCKVYELRPICCRLFGPFISHSTDLPDRCIYKNIAHKTEEKILFRIEPDLRRFQILKLKYELYKSENIGILIQLTEEFIAQNRLSDAIEILNQIYNKYPEEPAYYFYSGLICKWQRNMPEAISYFRECIKRKGEKKYPYVYEYLGLIYYSINELQKARETLEKALNILPNSPEAHIGMALVNLKEASNHCHNVLNIDPHNEVAFYLLEHNSLKEFL